MGDLYLVQRVRRRGNKGGKENKEKRIVVHSYVRVMTGDDSDYKPTSTRDHTITSKMCHLNRRVQPRVVMMMTLRLCVHVVANVIH